MAEKKWFWATLTLSSITIVSVVFAAWELVENHFFRDATYVTLHFLYITRGIASSLLLAFWAAWFVLRQRRRYEEDLRRSRERYRGLLESFPGAVILYDSDLIVLEWNASAERMYGYSKQEVCGTAFPAVPENRREELLAFMERVRRGEKVLDIETLRQQRDGTSFEAQLSLLPFRESRDALYFVEVTADIRERVRWRERMLEIEKLTSMGKMAAGTAHHLNSPLAALLLRVQLMKEGADGAPAEDLGRLEDGLKFCRDFVRRLLEFTRTTPAERGLHDLGAMLESVAGFFHPVILSKGASLRVDSSGVRGAPVLADRNLLETVLLILLSNALDATPRGGEIRILGRHVSPETIGFMVSDNGAGIRAENLKHVFEPFFTTKEPGKGTGLGLAIARNVVVEHGGAIRIESEAGRGTTVFVELPLAETAVLQQRAAS